MKSFLILILSIIVSLYSFSVLFSNYQKGTAVVEKQADKKYYCPMHPAIVSDNPGKCPKCGMDLEKKDADSQSPLIAILDKPTFEKEINKIRVQAWILTTEQRKSIVQHFRDNATDSIIKNRLNDSSFMNMMLKGTHHLIVRITDKDGKETGELVRTQITTPTKNKNTQLLNSMLEYYEGSLNLNEKGDYTISLYVKNEGKTDETQFNYIVE